jgi:hypothetical protein
MPELPATPDVMPHGPSAEAGKVSGGAGTEKRYPTAATGTPAVGSTAQPTERRAAGNSGAGTKKGSSVKEPLPLRCRWAPRQDRIDGPPVELTRQCAPPAAGSAMEHKWRTACSSKSPVFTAPRVVYSRRPLTRRADIGSEGPCDERINPTVHASIAGRTRTLRVRVRRAVT